jgi:hypothetical protein
LATLTAGCQRLPLVIELKKSDVPARAAFDENLTNYVGAGSHYFFTEITA